MDCKHEDLVSGKCQTPDCKYCQHLIKFNGLCAVCGEPVAEDEVADYINMSHKDTGLVVSRTEANRLEQEDEKRLIKEKKLSLIVDLDQTILHATWEPSIADWVKHKKETDSEAVKDISQFTLDGSPLIYSIKLRPGLSEFLRDISRKYEMHIYTMGTRSYAEAVVKVIDPKGELFQDRILSRDENGSMTKKRLERLFPSDTSKVVVLDDRADVWDYSENLIQIKPYEYFIGIGDINSPFAQPKKDIIPTTDLLQNVKPSNAESNSDNSSNGDNNISSSNSDSNVELVLKEQEQSNQENKEKSIEKQNVKEKDDVDDDDDDTYSDAEDGSDDSIKEGDISDNSSVDTQKDKCEETNSTNHLPSKTHDTDNTLRIIRRALLDVHNVYFNDLNNSTQRPDVASILNSLKKKVLKEVFVVFSGVIPIHSNKPEESWIWRMASSFGSTCLIDLTGKATHLIAANPGTSKVRIARKHPTIKIVTPAWITDSVWNWKKQDETKYLIPFAAASPAESDIENPETAPLDIDFNVGGLDWDDDEVDEAIGSDSEEEEDESQSSFIEDSDLHQQENANVQEPASPISHSSDGSMDDDEFRADMEAVLDAVASDDEDDQEYDSSDLERSHEDEQDEFIHKNERDESDNEFDRPAKKRK